MADARVITCTADDMDSDGSTDREAAALCASVVWTLRQPISRIFIGKLLDSAAHLSGCKWLVWAGCIFVEIVS